MSVEEAVSRDIGEMGELAHSALAASALALARELDKDDNSATSKANCAKVLGEILARLRAIAPPVEEEDDLDELSSRRARRLAG